MHNIKNPLQALEEPANDFGGGLFLDDNYIDRLCQQILTDLTYTPTDIDDLMEAAGAPAHAL